MHEIIEENFTSELGGATAIFLATLNTSGQSKAQQYCVQAKVFRSAGDSRNSYAKAEIWCPATFQWNFIYDIHYSQMKTDSGVLARENRCRDDFLKDLTRLLEGVERVLQAAGR